jgi:transient-receptor-potential-like protein
MVIDIVKFFFIYTLVLFAFACGKNNCFVSAQRTIVVKSFLLSLPFPNHLKTHIKGLNQLLWYYADLEKAKCYSLPMGLPDWNNEGDACMKWRRFGK